MELKNRQILLRFSESEIERLNQIYKQRLIDGTLISRSEFVRQMLEAGLRDWENNRNQ